MAGCSRRPRAPRSSTRLLADPVGSRTAAPPLFFVHSGGFSPLPYVGLPSHNLDPGHPGLRPFQSPALSGRATCPENVGELPTGNLARISEIPAPGARTTCSAGRSAAGGCAQGNRARPCARRAIMVPDVNGTSTAFTRALPGGRRSPIPRMPVTVLEALGPTRPSWRGPRKLHQDERPLDVLRRDEHPCLRAPVGRNMVPPDLPRCPDRHGVPLLRGFFVGSSTTNGRPLAPGYSPPTAADHADSGAGWTAGRPLTSRNWTRAPVGRRHEYLIARALRHWLGRPWSNRPY